MNVLTNPHSAAATESARRLNGAATSAATPPADPVSPLPPDALLLRPHRCGCRTCPTCSPILGGRVYHNLLGKRDLFPSPAHLPLTVDRHGTNTGKGFPDPEAAHDFIADGKYVARLMRLCGITRWACVMQLQGKTGEGWPHYHLLIDLSHLPCGKWQRKRAFGKLIDRLRRFWRHEWGIGEFKLNAWEPDWDESAGEVAATFISYITYYMLRAPDKPYPQWVGNRTKAIRFVSSSRAVGAIASPPGRGQEGAEDPPPRPFRPLFDRMAECGKSTDVFAVTVDALTGEERRVFRCSIPVSPLDLFGLSLAGSEPQRHGLPPMPVSVPQRVRLRDDPALTRQRRDGSTRTRSAWFADGPGAGFIGAAVRRVMPHVEARHAAEVAAARRAIEDAAIAAWCDPTR